jgi:hypothetical protein
MRSKAPRDVFLNHTDSHKAAHLLLTEWLL